MGMPWFPFYFSDYASKTDHLTLVEHGAYLMLLSTYYKTGKPIPANAEQVHRICRAFADAERDAIRSVLDQFFTLKEDGYHNDRVDEELKKAGDISEKRRKAALKRHSSDKSQPIKTMQVQSKSNTNAQQMDTQPQPHIQPQSQRQLQPPENTMSCKHDCIAVIDYLNQKSGRNYKPVDSNTKLVKGRLKEGYSVEDLKRVIDQKCAEWLTDQKMSQYLRPSTLFNAEKFNQYIGQVDTVDLDKQKLEAWINE